MAQYTFGGCPMLPGLAQMGTTESRCDSYTEIIFAHLADRPDLCTVIVPERFALHLDGAGFDNCDGGVEDVPAAPLTRWAPPLRARRRKPPNGSGCGLPRSNCATSGHE